MRYRAGISTDWVCCSSHKSESLYLVILPSGGCAVVPLVSLVLGLVSAGLRPLYCSATLPRPVKLYIAVHAGYHKIWHAANVQK